MRIKGIDRSKPNVEVVLFPRSDGEDIDIEATAVISYDRFDKLVKEPLAKTSLFPDGSEKPSPEQQAQFSKDMVEYYNMRHGFMLYETLKGNDNIEWGKITEDDPRSWLKCEKEIDGLPLTNAEHNRLAAAIHRANGLSDALIEEAENSFLERKALAKLKQENILNTEAQSSTSGVGAKD